jgi:hypothetical protein
MNVIECGFTAKTMAAKVPRDRYQHNARQSCHVRGRIFATCSTNSPPVPSAMTWAICFPMPGPAGTPGQADEGVSQSCTLVSVVHGFAFGGFCFAISAISFLKSSRPRSGSRSVFLLHVDGVVVTGFHGFVEQLHRPVGVLLLLVGDLATGDDVDAGKVVQNLRWCAG